MVRRISTAIASVARSSASTTKIHSLAARSKAAFLWPPIVVKGCENAVAPARRASSTVSSVESFSTTSISRAQRTLSIHARMLAASSRAAITTVTSTVEPSLNLSIDAAPRRSPHFRTHPPFPARETRARHAFGLLHPSQRAHLPSSTASPPWPRSSTRPPEAVKHR